MIIFRLLLQLVVLLGALLVHPGEASTYQTFANNHIAFPIDPSGYCDLMMRRKGLNQVRCKPINNFIYAPPSLIIAVCQGAGTHYEKNLFDSRRIFSVIHCTNTGRFPNCNYRGRAMIQRVRLGCVQRMPVHLAQLL
uniref:Ribonuclease A-domain domain-containing protein n=1 Tax=Pseudonaja textilis TaxID=8673 RepID=A0A670ZK36_PSETE